MTAKIARLTGERERRPFDNDLAEAIPARLDDDIGVPASDQTRTQHDSEFREPELHLWRRVLPQAGIHENLRLDIGDKWTEISDVNWNRSPRGEGFRHLAKIVRARRMHLIENRVSVEDRIGEGHPTTGGRRRRYVMKYDGMAFEKQAMSDRGPDVAEPAHNNCQGALVHVSRVPERVRPRLMSITARPPRGRN
jgi:hypothetical protein